MEKYHFFIFNLYYSGSHIFPYQKWTHFDTMSKNETKQYKLTQQYNYSWQKDNPIFDNLACTDSICGQNFMCMPFYHLKWFIQFLLFKVRNNKNLLSQVDITLSTWACPCTLMWLSGAYYWIGHLHTQNSMTLIHIHMGTHTEQESRYIYQRVEEVLDLCILSSCEGGGIEGDETTAW